MDNPENTEGAIKMDNPEKSATQDTQDEKKPKQKQFTICVEPDCTQTNTNNVNRHETRKHTFI